MYLADASLPALLDAVDSRPAGRDDLVVLFLAEEGRPDPERVVAALRGRDLEFVGGIFPGVIHGDRLHRRGAVVKVLPRRGRPFVVRGLERDRLDFPEVDLDGLDLHRPSTAIVLVDGLTSNISGFLAELYHRFGNAVHYLGGGAGSLSLRATPCLLTPAGVLQDAAVVGLVDLDSRLGVRHGWRKVTGPFVATRTSRNVIEELNWRNAFDVYREAVEADAGTPVTRESFYDVRKRYPFGIHREGCEDVVRDPIAVTEAGALVCVGEVPENAVLHVLKGDRRALVEAAGRAVQDCRPGEVTGERHGLVIDCVSRVLFLEEDFENELRAVRDGLGCDGEGAPQGALTLGEISSSGDGYLEFFNMTVVTGLLHG